jgi:hypothetical protein
MSLRTLNLSAAILHYSLAVGFSGYFLYINNKYGNRKVQGVELSTRDHVVDFKTTLRGNCVPDLSYSITCDSSNNAIESDTNSTMCDASNNCISMKFTSQKTSSIDIKVIQGMLISFFLITGTFHLFYYLGGNKVEGANDTSFGSSYTRMIAGRNNYLRWIEYSITSTIMLYIIAWTSGVKDTNVYLMLYSTNIAMIAQGQLIEEAVRDGRDWKIPMITGFVLLLAEFSVIARSFFSAINQVGTFTNDPANSTVVGSARMPSWIRYMIIVLFIMFSCFGFVSLYGAASGASFESVEKIYIILSFAAKATLGVFIAYGTGQRQRGRNN